MSETEEVTIGPGDVGKLDELLGADALTAGAGEVPTEAPVGTDGERDPAEGSDEIPPADQAAPDPAEDEPVPETEAERHDRKKREYGKGAGRVAHEKAARKQ